MNVSSDHGNSHVDADPIEAHRPQREERTASRKKPRRAFPEWIPDKLDDATTAKPNVDIELKRLLEVRTYMPWILEEPDSLESTCRSSPSFQKFAQQAAKLLQAPLAHVTLVDLARVTTVASFYDRALAQQPAGDASRSASRAMLQWSGQAELERKQSFCAHTILLKKDGPEALVVNDAAQSPFYADLPQVLCDGVRFYAGVPIVSSSANGENLRVGTLHVLDTEPRPNGISEIAQLGLFHLANELSLFLQQERERASDEGSASTPERSHAGDTVKNAGVDYPQSFSEESKATSLPMQVSFHHGDYVISQGDEAGFEEEKTCSASAVDIRDLIQGLGMAMEAIQRDVDIILYVDDDLPSKLLIDELVVFQCTVALLTGAALRTRKGRISMRVRLQRQPGQEDRVVFECEDTGANIRGLDQLSKGDLLDPIRSKLCTDEELFGKDCAQLNGTTCNSTKSCGRGVCSRGQQGEESGILGLQAVATMAQSIEGGDFGFHPRTSTFKKGHAVGSVFWFSFPL